jgi:putative transport protein
VPKFTKANMNEEVKKITVDNDSSNKNGKTDKLIEIDSLGLMPFALGAILGILLGSISYKGFSLTTTGGCILVALVLGHFQRIGKISIMPKVTMLRVLRELGLMLFLIGAGVSGGANFIKVFNPIYLLYGVFMTLVPMIIGYLFARYILKLPLLNNLGSITGGMTSTPALGTLISVSGTEDIATAYAATYPIALIAIVLASKLIIMFV